MSLETELEEVIDAFLVHTKDRGMYSAQQMQDLCLDLRLVVAKHKEKDLVEA